MLKPFITLFVTLLAFSLYSQDEGLIERKARFEHPHSIGIQIGPLFRMGKADYKGGYLVSATYTSRVNRILSIGPALTFSRFAFQPSLTNSFEKDGVKGNNIFQEDSLGDDGNNYLGYAYYVATLRGGNLNQLTAGLNLKLDMMPFKPDRKFNWTVGIQPFLLANSRSEVSGTINTWYLGTVEDPLEWEKSGEFKEEDSNTPGRSNWASKTEVSGGVLVTAGVEIALPGNWKLQVLPALRYTFPITHVKTATFSPLESSLNSSRFPFAKESLTTVGVVVAMSYHF
ncbi:MAG: hypothetical protein UZ12_BCD005001527 [Bacteroidetes bacterium OLB12]|nr:MAG: hypothetical protein UZ12_BCD005001527 [Bacteroidetes bacterium OLB12]